MSDFDLLEPLFDEPVPSRKATPQKGLSGDDLSTVSGLTSHHIDMASVPFNLDDLDIHQLLGLVRQFGASDMHLTADLPPVMRIDGELHTLPCDLLDSNQIQRLVYEVLTDEQISQFERKKELDFSFGTAELGRFRFNLYKQRGAIGAAIRAIPAKIPTFEQLNLPPVLKELTRLQSGLVLVTGPTGSGKSTTIAVMIDTINSLYYKHIMTIEDPIEYVHKHKRAMVNQREIGSDSDSFHDSIRAVLREDPDVILLGEMRDLETIQAALTLAETGHLVFGTLHTRSAAQTVDRIIDVFSPEQQEQIRVLLANTLQAIITQQLMPAVGGGRVGALEILLVTSATRNLIREGKTHQIPTVIETGGNLGMQSMDKALVELVRQGRITLDMAMERAADRDNIVRIMTAI